MSHHRQLAALAAATILVCSNGCTTMSPVQCASADWYQVGVADGTAGLAIERVADHARACAGYGQAPDQDRYAEGRSDGLMEYCTTGNGLKAGRKGEAYRGVCPADRESDFLTGYRLGAIAYRGF